ncbi:MAG: DMT family transporter, partial [Flavobacteriia bacterium]
STVQYLAPIFTIFFAVILSGEQIKNHQWIFILSALLGVLLISSPNFLSNDLADISLNWLLVGILSATFSGLAYSSIVKLKNTEDPLNVVLYFPMIAIPIMLVWCFFDFVMPVGIEWLLLIIMGVFTQIAQLFLTKGLMSEETSIVAPFQYLGAIYAALAGYLIFDESLSIIVYVGIAMILAGVIFNTISAKK